MIRRRNQTMAIKVLEFIGDIFISPVTTLCAWPLNQKGSKARHVRFGYSWRLLVILLWWSWWWWWWRIH